MENRKCGFKIFEVFRAKSRFWCSVFDEKNVGGWNTDKSYCRVESAMMVQVSRGV